MFRSVPALINLLMNLPIDCERADEAAALTYLRELEASWEAEVPVVGANGIISTKEKTALKPFSPFLSYFSRYRMVYTINLIVPSTSLLQT